MKISFNKERKQINEFVTNPVKGIIEVKGSAAEIAALWVKQQPNPTAKNSAYFGDHRSFYGSLTRAEQLFKNTAIPPKPVVALDLTQLKTSLGTAKKRIRETSDLDGEFNYDRRALDNCFDTVKKIKSNRCITLNCFFGFLADVETTTINRYGELIYSVACELERAGIRTEINLVNQSHTVTTLQHGFEALLTIKKSSEYLDRRLFRFFTVEFFRRAIFNLKHHAADQFGLVVDGSLGYTAYPKVQSAKPGIINLTPTDQIKSLDQAKLIELIKTALK